MRRVGIAIDQSTNDLQIAADGNLVMVRDAHAVGQHARQRLQTFEGEWFLDGTVGVPWLTQILGKGYDPALSEAVVKATLLATDGVIDITSFSVGFNQPTRGLNIRGVEIKTDYDQVVQV